MEMDLERLMEVGTVLASGETEWVQLSGEVLVPLVLMADPLDCRENPRPHLREPLSLSRFRSQWNHRRPPHRLAKK